MNDNTEPIKERPVISIGDFIDLYDMDQRTGGFFGHYLWIFLQLMIHRESFFIEDFVPVMPGDALKEPASSLLGSFLDIFERIRNNMLERADNSSRQYFSEGDVIRDWLKESKISAELIKMLGGGDECDGVAYFTLDGGILIPHNARGEQIPGPSIIIRVEKVDDIPF